MESIQELRKICQVTRSTIWKDFLNKFYYFVSIYFTWLLIKLKLSANNVTILSGICAILGGCLIATDNKSFIFLGLILFHIFAILDMCDGEVARYNKSSHINGQFLDWFMHFIYSIGFMGGLSFYVIYNFSGTLFIIISLIAFIIPLFDKIITSASWTAIIWTKLRRHNNPDKLVYIKKDPVLNNETNTLYKLISFFLYHLFSDHWAKLSLLCLSIIDLFLHILNIEFIDYRLIIVFYIGLIGPVYIFRRLQNILDHNNLSKAYNRIFVDNKEPKFPDDDFV